MWYSKDHTKIWRYINELDQYTLGYANEYWTIIFFFEYLYIYITNIPDTRHTCKSNIIKILHTNHINHLRNSVYFKKLKLSRTTSNVRRQMVKIVGYREKDNKKVEINTQINKNIKIKMKMIIKIILKYMGWKLQIRVRNVAAHAGVRKIT